MKKAFVLQRILILQDDEFCCCRHLFFALGKLIVIYMKEFDPVLFAKALADETRQKIMKICCCNWLSVTEIVEHLNVTQPTVSHHLAILREAELVEVREDGKQTFYRLNQKQITVCCGELRPTFAAERVVPVEKVVQKI